MATMISFIVPAYNEEALIARTLRSIHAAAGAVAHPYEIVVVSDASTDQTAVVAESLGARVVHVAHRQIAATRNAGARVAAGEWLVFVDADTVVSTAAVRGAVNALARGAAGGGSAVRFDGVIPWHARLILPLALALYRIARLAPGCFLFCTRAVFEKTGGFDESLYASEEVWMSRAIGRCGRFVVLSAAVETSGRKLRQHSAREIYGLLLHLLVRGDRLRSRQGLELWYGERRDDPGGQSV
ncbi:putative glycosyltransferase EpsJ [Phycisphaerae bacterium RAS1]|nr:putative glycosyltransferase EpsJ [Phycisphaerae bacterium RAS1]